MMNHTDGWMGVGMWIWTVIGVVMLALLVVMINKLTKNNLLIIKGKLC